MARYLERVADAQQAGGAMGKSYAVDTEPGVAERIHGSPR
jgi:hypothetical protein